MSRHRAWLLRDVTSCSERTTYINRSRSRAVAISLFVPVLCALLLPQAAPAETDARAISGFIVLAPPRAQEQRPIYVPGVAVTLTDLLAQSDVARVRTDLSGRFRFAPVKPSRYHVCWKARGIKPGCSEPFSVQKQHVYLQQLPAAAVIDGEAKTYYGKVRFANGQRTRALEPMLGINAFATVVVEDGSGGRPRRAYVNNFGEYVLPGVTGAAGHRLRARIEAAEQTADTGPVPGFSKRIDISFRDQHPPELNGLVGSTGAGRHWTAAPGDVVQVKAVARDPDNDTLSYRWVLPNGSFLASPSASDTTSFQLPARPGLYEFTALVADGRGGYDEESIEIATEGVRFAGLIAATDAPLLAGAEIEINGTTTASGSDGRFSIRVQESPRYVLNVRKPGYGLVSRIYDNGLTGGRWTLTRASVVSVDTRQPIDVVNERRPDDCPGSLSERNRQTHGEPQRARRECGPGIRVRIPANALVDANGQAPSGNVTIETTTVDLRAPDAMPGDYTARDDSGNLRVMQSFGAGTVEIRDGDTEYRLKPGESAEVTIPIDAAQLASPASIPPSIPLLSYDESAGIWVQEGILQRVGNSYVGNVAHFSAINADALKVNQACVRLETTLLPEQFNLETTFPPDGGGADIVKTALITNDVQRFHVIINLPTNSSLTLKVFDLTNQVIPLLDVTQQVAVPPTVQQLTVNTGGPQNPTTPNQPEFPYAACQVSVELTPSKPVGAVVDEFLHGLFSFQAANLTELDASDPATAGEFKNAGDAYYKAIDPHGLRETLDEFKLRNGFPAGEINLQYANSGDLGFGRDMHCRKLSSFGATGEYACYVTNYGSRFTDDDQDQVDALQNNTPIATVGMEYSRSEAVNDATGNTLVGDPMVKFYVYKEANNNKLANSANLDGVGERPVPQLCMVCHGGHYKANVDVNAEGVPQWTDAASADLTSHFIPFDLASLSIFNPTGQQNQDRLRQLNCDIVRNAAPTPELNDVIAAMYGPGCTGNQIVGGAVPGWADNTASTPNLPNKVEVYGKVVTPACRSCHISQAPSAISWAQASDFSKFASSIDFRVCSSHEMPHALVTHNRFWLSTQPHQPLLLHNFLNGNDPPDQPTTNPHTTAGLCIQE